MTKIYFEELMRELGCRTVDDTAFGMANGYPFSVELLNTAEPSRLRVQWVLRESAALALAALQQQRVQYLRWAAEADAGAGGALAAYLAPPSDFYTKALLRGTLKAGAAALAAAGNRVPEICPLCGLAGCDTLAFLDEGLRPTHAACLQDRLALPQKDEIPESKIKGNWATGVLGALLGAVVGAAPLFSMALSRHKLYAAFYAFIPLFSGLLYRLFRGKARRNPAGAIVIACSLLLVFFMELVWHWILLTEQQGLALTFWQAAANYLHNFQLLPTLYAMLLDLLFFVAGLFPAAIILRRYEGSGKVAQRPVRGAEFVRASAEPFVQSSTQPGPEGGPPRAGNEKPPESQAGENP